MKLLSTSWVVISRQVHIFCNKASNQDGSLALPDSWTIIIKRKSMHATVHMHVHVDFLLHFFVADS